MSERIPILDREVDRLTDLAVAQSWSRLEFRSERMELGRLAAEYIRAARRIAKLPEIEIRSIWTWDRTADGR